MNAECKSSPAGADAQVASRRDIVAAAVTLAAAAGAVAPTTAEAQTEDCHQAAC